jgi:hypothetical protein
MVNLSKFTHTLIKHGMKLILFCCNVYRLKFLVEVIEMFKKENMPIDDIIHLSCSVWRVAWKAQPKRSIIAWKLLFNGQPWHYILEFNWSPLLACHLLVSHIELMLHTHIYRSFWKWNVENIFQEIDPCEIWV